MSERSGKATAALGLAIAGLVTSIVGFGLIFAIAAIALGRKAMEEIDASDGRIAGASRARGAQTLGAYSAAISCLVIFLAVLMVANGRPHRPIGMKNGTQMTAISKNMVLWSDQYYQQSQDYPRAGLDPDPKTFGYPRGIPTNSPEDRIAALMNMGTDVLSPWMLINPVGVDDRAQGTPPDIVLQANNLSYAVLDALNKEWRNNINSSAPMLADKQVGKGTYWNKKCWEGDVVWGDTHVTWETAPHPDGWPSTTIAGHTTIHDDLFKGTTGPGATDAVLFNP